MTTGDDTAADIVTSDQASTLLGIKPGTLRQWVFRGDLVPLIPGGRPLRFRYDDLARVQRDKRSKDWAERHRQAVERWSAAHNGEAM